MLGKLYAGGVSLSMEGYDDDDDDDAMGCTTIHLIYHAVIFIMHDAE